MADFNDDEFSHNLTNSDDSSNRMLVRKDPHPDIARIIIAGPWDGDGRKASALLRAIAEEWAGHEHTDFLITPGGFIRFAWPDHVPEIGDVSYPNGDAVDTLNEAARRAVRASLSPTLCNELKEYTRYLSIGADSKNDQNEVEFVCVCDLETGKTFWTGKSYPNTEQESRLVRIKDLSTHFLPLLNQSVLILGCHDLHMFNNRADGRENLSPWRKETREGMKKLSLEKKPTIILQHPHTTDSVRTWSQAWSGLLEKIPTVNSYASAGLYYKWGEQCRSPIDNVLNATKMGATLDFIHQTETPISEKMSIRPVSPMQITTSENISPLTEITSRFERMMPLLAGFIKIRTRKDQVTYSFSEWKKKLYPMGLRVHYEFNHWIDAHKVSVEFQCYPDECLPLFNIVNSRMEDIASKMPGGAESDVPYKSHWHRIRFLYDENTNPELVSNALKILIYDTKDLIDKWIRGFEQN
ncbi:MAG TPA: hypothetical protein PKJ91_00235 [Methanoregulaceae archaeon]|nr:hypothetical protein [Methanoregulaceae archaeon]